MISVSMCDPSTSARLELAVTLHGDAGTQAVEQGAGGKAHRHLLGEDRSSGAHQLGGRSDRHGWHAHPGGDEVTDNTVVAQLQHLQRTVKATA